MYSLACQHNVFEIQPRHCIQEKFILVYGWPAFRRVTIPHVFIYSPMDEIRVVSTF